MWWPAQNDFNYHILDVTEHRPWPLPSSRWVMTQTWHDLLFAHWPVELAVLRAKVPSAFPVDTFDGQAWIGIVPFHMSNIAPRGVPALPWISAFPELNVRTYVTLDGKPGVDFFSLDAANPIAVQTARRLAHLPYYTAAMHVAPRDGWIDYRSHRTAAHAAPAEFVGRYVPVGPATPPLPGTLEYFLTERYCLYTEDRRGRSTGWTSTTLRGRCRRRTPSSRSTPWRKRRASGFRTFRRCCISQSARTWSRGCLWGSDADGIRDSGFRLRIPWTGNW